MIGRTHDLAAFTALNILLVTKPIPDMSLSTALVAVGACLMGGLAPDIDNSTSQFLQKFPTGTFIGRLLHPLVGGHRLISHFKFFRLKTGGLIEKFFIFPGLLILNGYLFYNYYQVYIKIISKLIR
ncbi:MAG: hypothetical protein Q7R43_05030 [Candidatus Daviesbacteria bacterium]|nr:hypothetical protein [Candidatus Daviesbacteria bacterium]